MGCRRVGGRERGGGRACVVACFLFAATVGTVVPLGAQATIRIAAYNVRHGAGMDDRVDLTRAAEVLRALDADVITLQEIDRGVERTGGVDQAAALGEMLGMQAHFGDFMPYQGGEYGMAILSRLPVLGVRNIRLPDGEEPRTALEVQVVAADPNGAAEPRVLSVVGIHLYMTPEERLAQADTLSARLRDTEHPAVLAGDFNSRRGDIVLRSLLDAGWFVLDKEGSSDTYPADEPVREIDFVMLRPASAFEVVEHRVVDERLASDHRPLLVVLRLW